MYTIFDVLLCLLEKLARQDGDSGGAVPNLRECERVLFKKRGHLSILRGGDVDQGFGSRVDDVQELDHSRAVVGDSDVVSLRGTTTGLSRAISGGRSTEWINLSIPRGPSVEATHSTTWGEN